MMAESATSLDGNKTEKLLKEVGELKGPIERTLMDVREVLAAVDSPLRAAPAVQQSQRSEQSAKGQLLEELRRLRSGGSSE